MGKDDPGILKVKAAHKIGGSGAAMTAVFQNANDMLEGMEEDLNAGKPVHDVFNKAKANLLVLALHASELRD